MAGRRPPVCLICQARQASIGRRRFNNHTQHHMTVASVQVQLPPVEVISLPSGKVSGLIYADQKAKISRNAQHLSFDSLSVDLDGALRDLNEFVQGRDVRVRVLRSLSKPWPIATEQVRCQKQTKVPLQLPEANAAPIPHNVFRERLRDAQGDKSVRTVLRAQLLRCSRPREIFRVVAVAMQKDATAYHLSGVHDSITRALFRCRENVEDTEVLRALNSIISRLRYRGLEVNDGLLSLGVKFAARCRSSKDMRRYLKAIRNTGRKMSSNLFRSVIAKFSIGHRGLGEIRNGRWKREELLQVLKGFDGTAHLPSEEQYHFETFLDRSDWQYLHGWIAVLGRCRDTDAIVREWELWKDSAARLRPKNLASIQSPVTSKSRGDYWFVEQMACAGGTKQAWRILSETDLNFKDFKHRVQTRLLDGVEHSGKYGLWNEDVRSEMLRKYDTDLTKIESILGVKWVVTSTSDESKGHHILVDDQEEVLERLGSPDWKMEEDYGYPLDSVQPEERRLHDAAETTPVAELRRS